MGQGRPITMTPSRGGNPYGMDHLQAAIAADLAEAEIIFQQELQSTAPHVRELVAHLAHYRGKRLRPILLLLTAKACGNVTREHHVLAAVVEMIHTATLVHDDILDNADLRRHVPTVNKQWGAQSSVLLGDLLFTHAFFLASTTGSTLACKMIGETTNRVCEGELHQIGEQGNLKLTEEEYLAIIGGKTAALTGCCCQLGAIFSGAGEAVVEQLTRFGNDLGLAFQMIDDILDLTGEETQTGKSLGTDLAQKKLTLPIIHLLRYGSAEVVRLTRQIIVEPSPSSIGILRSLLMQAGSLEYTLQQAERYARNARQALQVLPETEYRQILENLTVHVVHRSH